MDHSPLPSPNSGCFPSNVLPEFDGHIPLGKFQQELAQPWHPPPSNLMKATKILDNSFGFGNGRLLPAFAMEGLSTPQSFRDSPELAGNSTASESWDAGVGHKLSYASSLGSMLPASRSAVLLGSSISSQGQAVSESRAGVTDLVGRMEINGNPTGGISSILASSSPLSEVERLMNLGSNSWGSLNATMGLTVDPSKGGLAIQGTNLGGASYCLSNFSTDPGFVERAAKFSCFSNQNYPELAQPFSVPDGGKTFINRSAPRAFDKLTLTKITRVPSGHLTPRCSAPNSPVGATVSGSAKGQNCTSENFSLKATQESALVVEDLKVEEKRSGRMSCSPSRIDGSEGIQKHSTSMNESDEADGSLGQEESSSCERGAYEGVSQGMTENPAKKRRIGSKVRSKDSARVANQAEVKDLETDEGKRNCHNIGDDAKEEEQTPTVEQTNSGNSGDSTPKSVKESSKPPEAPKSDFIHVRARRGQATDSHSLAERVRREKISERMKYLQDLVPGCSKVTGKAVMLDEIINYVQSLQRQVEFLSMKLAAVNPRVDMSIESLFGREMFQPRVAPSSALLFAPENTNSYPPLQQQQGPMQGGGSCPPVDVHPLGSDPALRRTVSNPVASMNGFGDSVSQISQAWEDELQSVVQMGFAQGRLFPGQMKVEL